MNVKSNSKPVNWRKMLSAGILVAVLAYTYGHPYIEKWTGWDLPSISQNNHDHQNRDSGDDDFSSRGSNPGGPTAAKIGGTDSSSSSDADAYLTPTGKKNRLASPAGLVYGESRGEHRVDHVMRHGADMKNRPVHSVFDGSKGEILKLIDEAYELIKSKSNRVRSKPDDRLDFRVAHTVDMKRKIGYLGGKSGSRQNYPSRSKLTLVLDNEKFVITAYPDD